MTAGDQPSKGEKMKRRWVCGLCGSFVLGPGKPRKDNACRICLPCTGRTGKLVQRTCPALDKRRASKAEAKERTKRAKMEAASARRREISQLRRDAPDPDRLFPGVSMYRLLKTTIEVTGARVRLGMPRDTCEFQFSGRVRPITRWMIRRHSYGFPWSVHYHRDARLSHYVQDAAGLLISLYEFRDRKRGDAYRVRKADVVRVVRSQLKLDEQPDWYAGLYAMRWGLWYAGKAQAANAITSEAIVAKLLDDEARAVELDRQLEIVGNKWLIR